jgi:lipid-A-disaccharide synthase-like uncharacterized protein
MIGRQRSGKHLASFDVVLLETCGIPAERELFYWAEFGQIVALESLLRSTVPTARPRKRGSPPPVAAKKIRCDRLRMQSLLAILQVATLEINAWKIIGWTGNLIFGLRFVWQWIASERAKKSIIPPGFWEISLLGSMIYTSYFIFYRHDSVGIISNLLPLPLYARNVFLHWRHARNDKKVQESTKEEDSLVD